MSKKDGTIARSRSGNERSVPSFWTDLEEKDGTYAWLMGRMFHPKWQKQASGTEHIPGQALLSLILIVASQATTQPPQTVIMSLQTIQTTSGMPADQQAGAHTAGQTDRQGKRFTGS